MQNLHGHKFFVEESQIACLKYPVGSEVAIEWATYDGYETEFGIVVAYETCRKTAHFCFKIKTSGGIVSVFYYQVKPSLKTFTPAEYTYRTSEHTNH